MTVLDDYNSFVGTHWETGSVVNVLDHRGVKAPHTGEPYSEALLLGVSGGAVMGYFSFAYEGYDPQARILTRNTFDPWDTMLSRLGVVQDVQHTGSAARGVRNLVEALEAGHAPVVWADTFSLPYNALPSDESMWAMFPHVVFGYDESTNQAWLADRAPVPLSVSAQVLHAARARVKKDKFRVITLEPPLADKLASAVQLGIWDSIKLYTEGPPKGSKNSFGLRAYEWWAEQLTNPRARLAWEKVFPPGRKMLAGLASAYHDIIHFGKRADPADRGKFAHFLDEAAVILERSALAEVADHFRRAAEAWQALGLALLPDEVEPFGQYRRLADRSHALFAHQGAAATEMRRQIATEQEALLAAMEADFPLDTAAVQALREQIAVQVLAVRDIEAQAVTALKGAMA
ncbi:MAG: BtrH N-terminal domain-containing protein [Candidatus Promineifilaceae bacterium]|nr:BtrH N-terminal domain-containing protein [Candidatus Promineifilaceae bacterium]